MSNLNTNGYSAGDRVEYRDRNGNKAWARIENFQAGEKGETLYEGVDCATKAHVIERVPPHPDVIRTRELRKKLLGWHRHKSRSVSLLDLLQSNYQGWRYAVSTRILPKDASADLLRKGLDFREAIRRANLDELEKLQWIRDEEWAEARLRRK